MRRVFPDRIEDKAELMRRVQSGVSSMTVPRAEVDLAAELPSVVAESAGEDFTGATPAPPRPRSWGRIAGVAALAAAAVAGVVVLRMRAPVTPPPPIAAAVAAPAESAPTPAGAEQVVIELVSDPPGARVKMGGEDRGTTPLELRLDRGAAPVDVEISHEGHVPQIKSLVPDSDRTVRVVLASAALLPGTQRPSAGRRPAASAPKVEATAQPAVAPSGGYYKF